jgi:hypothetical protein
MPDNALVAFARHARERAEEALTRAETFNDNEARRTMRRLAESYVKLAERLEQEAGNAP